MLRWLINVPNCGCIIYSLASVNIACLVIFSIIGSVISILRKISLSEAILKSMTFSFLFLMSLNIEEDFLFENAIIGFLKLIEIASNSCGTDLPDKSATTNLERPAIVTIVSV